MKLLTLILSFLSIDRLDDKAAGILIDLETGSMDDVASKTFPQNVPARLRQRTQGCDRD